MVGSETEKVSTISWRGLLASTAASTRSRRSLEYGFMVRRDGGRAAASWRACRAEEGGQLPETGSLPLAALSVSLAVSGVGVLLLTRRLS